MAILLGMPILVAFIVVVALGLLIPHLAYDQKYDATKGQPDSARLAAWYAR